MGKFSGPRSGAVFDGDYDKIIEIFFRGHLPPKFSLWKFCLKSWFLRRAVNFRISTLGWVPLILDALSHGNSQFSIPWYFYKKGKQNFTLPLQICRLDCPGKVGFSGILV